MKNLALFQSAPQNNPFQFLAKFLLLVPFVLALFLLSGFLALFSSATQAAPLETIVLNIDTALDSNETVYQACTSAPDDCSLRGAISVANTDSANVYTLNLPPGTYTLTLSGRKEDNNATGDLDLNGTITLVGTDAVTTTINAAQRDRVLQVLSGAVVKLENLTLANGLTADGANGSTGNPGSAGGPGEPGGGLYNSGTLTISRSTLINHQTGNGGRGGGTLSICPWDFSYTYNGLPGGDGGPGGAIYNQGTLTIQETTLQHNQTGNGEEGGAGGGLGTCTGDSGVSGDGGAGAGVYNASDGVLLVTSSTLDANLTGAGQRFIDNTDLSTQTGGNGGLGGGFYNAGTLRLRNSTLSGNLTGDGGAGYYSDATRGGLAGIAGHGSGLYNTGTFSATHSTITNNSVGIEGDGKANPVNGSGGGFYQAAGAAEFRNTIIAGNDMPTSAAYADCYGTLTSQNYNLVGSGTGCPHNGGQDQTTGDPKLSPLADNGGPTRTHALQPDSPAREGIPPGSNGCLPGYSSDQRGAVRADGINRGETSCDIGAYEYNSDETPSSVRLQSFSAHLMDLPAPDLSTIVLSVISLLVLSLLILVTRFNRQAIKGARDLRR